VRRLDDGYVGRLFDWSDERRRDKLGREFWRRNN
jgi:hypothetical protein